MEKIKSSYNNNKLNISAPNEIKILNYLIGHVLYQIFKTISSIFYKKDNENIDSPSIRIYENRIEKRITFKIKIEYYLELLIPETMKPIGNVLELSP